MEPKDLFLLVAGCFLATGLVSWGAFEITKCECVSRAEAMGKRVQFGFFTGCMIQVKGEWIPMSQYRVID